uniref:Uncharacterized protein n=1 Tax=Cucumis melo TaxID=3656 RepID=A0A9I9D7W1_CUCME
MGRHLAYAWLPFGMFINREEGDDQLDMLAMKKEDEGGRRNMLGGGEGFAKEEGETLKMMNSLCT